MQNLIIKKLIYFQIYTLIENTFSLLHDFLFVFHVLVIAPSRKWIGFFAFELPLLPDWLGEEDRCFSLDDSPTIVD